METTGVPIGELLLGIAAIISAVLGGIKLMQNESDKKMTIKLDQIIDENDTRHKQNFEQHKKIFDTLTIVEDTVLRKEIVEGLRAIVRGYFHFNAAMDGKAKILVDSQCERIIELCEEMMNQKFSPEAWEQANIKVEVASAKGKCQVIELYGEEFAHQYVIIQKRCTNDFMHKLHKLSVDNIVNSKYSRFRTYVESFLHSLISETLELIHKWQLSHPDFSNKLD